MAITIAPVNPGATGALGNAGENANHFKYGFVDITFDTENLSTGEDVSAILTYFGWTALVGLVEMGSLAATNDGFVHKLDNDGVTLVTFYQAGRTATTVAAGVLITAASANLATNPGLVRFLAIGY